MKSPFALFLVSASFCGLSPHGTVAKTLRTYFPEKHKNNTYVVKSDGTELFLDSKLEPNLMTGIKPSSIESNVIEMIKQKFYDLTDNPRKRLEEDEDDPNHKQWLMAHAFIDSLNDVFRRPQMREDDFGCSGIKPHRNVLDERKKDAKGWNRVDIASLVENDDPDGDKGPRGGFRPVDSRPLKDTSVHCVRSGPNTIICSHDNFTYALSLPEAMIKQETVENLVSSICSIVESSGTGEESIKGGIVSLTVSNGQIASGPIQSASFVASSESPKKMVKINIPIDFDTLPLSLADSTVPPVQAEISYLAEAGQPRPRNKRKMSLPYSSPLLDLRLTDLPRLYRRVSLSNDTSKTRASQPILNNGTITQLTLHLQPPLNI